MNKQIATLDNGPLASARESSRRTSVRVGTLAFTALGMLATIAAQAQSTGPGYGLGANGAPAASDYLSAGTGFASQIAPILTTMLPLLLGMLAVWQGPRIIKGLVQRFSH